MMKNILVLVWILTMTRVVYGQQSVDYLLKARAFDAAGKPELAVKALTEAISISNESCLFIERAEARINQRAYSEAISDLNEANRITPFSGEYGLAKVYAMKGDAATSLYHLEINMNSPFRRGEKEIMLDPAFSSIDNRSEWRQFWKKEWYSFTEKSISEIEYYTSSGNIDESRTILSDLMRIYPGSDEILYAQALISMSSGKYSEAVNFLSGLATKDPVNPKYLRTLAKAQSLSGNPAGASLTYTQLFGSDVADAEMLILRAECYRKTGEIDKSLRDLEKYLELYPESKSALSLAGKAEALSGDNLKAIDYFSKNLKLHPNDADCYVDRANSYFVSKTWDWAIKDYSMSLDLNPSDPDVWLNKGVAQLNSGRVDDACHDFRKALNLGNKRASEYISNNCIK
jgi:tetratricopeptide (TPR) repeat protein